MVLETRRLILRPWAPEDAEELYRYACDPRIGPSAGFPAHTSVQNSREVIRGVLAAPETYAVVLRETGLPVGSVGIKRQGGDDAPPGNTEAEIGYWIGVPYWGRGLIPEAVRELLRRCFEDLGCTAVWCGYYEGNGQSRRVQEKCGFVPHHVREDAPCAIPGERRREYFSRITREQWRALRASPAWTREEGAGEREIACCGLDCGACDARAATLEDDDALRERTARRWSELNHAVITPEMIHCTGCRAEGVKTYYCACLCEIRRCALRKELRSCAACPDLETCGTLGALLAHNPSARERLWSARREMRPGEPAAE